MAERKPLVLIGSTIRQLPTGDTVEGATGATGPQGPAGPTGPTGATGPQGPAGSGSTPLVRTPTNLIPANGATAVAVAPPLTANAYGSVYGVAHQGSRWQVDTTSDFASPVYDSGDFSSGVDPYSVNVSLLARFDSGFQDLTGKTITAVGNAAISSTQSKFGGSSVYLDGSGDYMYAPTGTAFAFGTGEFTVEMWVYLEPMSNNYQLYDSCQLGGDGARGAAWTLEINVGGTVKVYRSGGYTAASTLAIAESTWTHVAVCRNGGSFNIYIGGALALTFSNAQDLTVGGCVIGRYADGGGGNWFKGYIDDIRITKGVARYTAAFTPPTTRHPQIGAPFTFHTPPSNLAANTLHYWRCMYRDSDNVDSAWSTATSFTTGYPPD